MTSGSWIRHLLAVRAGSCQARGDMVDVRVVGVLGSHSGEQELSSKHVIVHLDGNTFCLEFR